MSPVPRQLSMSPNPQTERSAGPRAILADRIFDGRRWLDARHVLGRASCIGGVESWGAVAPVRPKCSLPPDAILAPGFIDLQVNGGGGTLLNDLPTAEGMRAIARAHRRFGTTACLPTLISDTRERIATAAEAAKSFVGQDGVLGLHIEGPFINPRRKGVHRADLIAVPESADLDLLECLGAIGRSLVTLAPECVPAGFIARLSASGVRVSVGHSEATADEIACAVDDGLTGVTHLFNAMPPFAARAPGIIGAALADQRLVAGMIVDGLHVDPVAIRAAFAAKGAKGVALVTDAMPSVGSGIACFDLMGRRIN